MAIYKTHLGVYGVCIREKKLLCINKNRGPKIDTIYQEVVKKNLKVS